MLLRPLCYLLGLTVFLPSSTQAADLDLAPVERWISSQSSVKTFQGEFIQERTMKSLKSPITKKGKVWFEAPLFARWQIGEDPGERVAVKNDKEVLVLQPKKKKLERHSLEELRNQENLRGLTFLENGFPRSLAEFQKNFEVRSVKKEQDYFLIDTKMRDGKASAAVLKMTFFIHEGDYQLKAFRLEFRDRSTIYTRLTRVDTGRPIDPKIFRPDLAGYEEEKS